MNKKQTSCIIGGAQRINGRLELFAFPSDNGETGRPVPKNTSSEKFFVGINANDKNHGMITHIVESYGKSVEETAQRLLASDRELDGDDSIGIGLSATEIPMAETADIASPGLFVIEATERLYQEVELIAGKHVTGQMFGTKTPVLLLACRIAVSESGSLIACAYDLDPTGRISGIRIVEEPMDEEKITPLVMVVDSVLEKNGGLEMGVFQNKKQGIETLPDMPSAEERYVGMMIRDQYEGIVMSNGLTAEEAAENCQVSIKNFIEDFGDSDIINNTTIPSVEDLLPVHTTEDCKIGDCLILPCTEDLYHAADLIEAQNRIWTTPTEKKAVCFVTCRLARARDGTLMAALHERDTPSAEGENNPFSPSSTNLVANAE